MGKKFPHYPNLRRVVHSSVLESAMGLTAEDPLSPSGGRHTQFKAFDMGMIGMHSANEIVCMF